MPQTVTASAEPRIIDNLQRPQIIQGGMGVAISSWQLANAVARRGELGVVSGTILEVVMARRLQLGDPGDTSAVPSTTSRSGLPPSESSPTTTFRAARTRRNHSRMCGPSRSRQTQRSKN